MSVAITTKQTVEVKVSQKLQTQLRETLRTYARLAEQRKAIKAELQRLSGSISSAFERAREWDALVAGVEVDGFKLKHVPGTHSKLNISRLMEDYGVTQTMIDETTETKPRRPYLKVTVPGIEEED